MGNLQRRQHMSYDEDLTDVEYSAMMQAQNAQQAVARRMSMKSRLTMADIATNLMTKETLSKYK